MTREFLNSRFLIILFVLGGLLAIGGYYVFQPERNPETAPPSLPKTPRLGKQEPPAQIKSVHSHHPLPVGPSDVGPSLIPADKQERIQAVWDRTPYSKYSKAEKEVIEILAEGMDTLSAAKYLRALGYDEASREYTERALAENPDDFDTLLYYVQHIPYDSATMGKESYRKKLAGYRQLYEMNPNSVEVLYGLGVVLLWSKPKEAVEHLQKAIAISPTDFDAHIMLGDNYLHLGRKTKSVPLFNEALAAYQKAHQLKPSWFTQNAIQIANEEIEWYSTHNMKSVPEAPQPQTPLSEEAALSTPTEALINESRADESPTTEPSAEQDDARADEDASEEDEER